MNKTSIINAILPNHGTQSLSNGREQGYAFAPTNIALCKYWGKRDEELNLPITSSLSLTLSDRGVFTVAKHIKGNDRYYVNGRSIKPDVAFAIRLKEYLDLFRPAPEIGYQIETDLNIPIGAGLASSAAGFAALIRALNNLYAWNLSVEKLSILARLGSGSACRSLWNGFVEWQAGSETDGMDSHGIPLPNIWPELRVGVLIFSTKEKILSSREAMQRTIQTAPSYAGWPVQADNDLQNLKQAIFAHDFERFGQAIESNSLFLHEMMLDANPPINYFMADTCKAIQTVHDLRKKGTQVFFTQDAGPNLQILFLAKDTECICKIFPRFLITTPFPPQDTETVMLVDTKDREIRSAEKVQTHVNGDLHRAFSVFILRENAGEIEVLLQQRAAGKYHSAGLWSNTCCGHPLSTENIVEAGEKRLQAELGFSLPLENIGSFTYYARLNQNGANAKLRLIENEVDHVLLGFSSDKLEFTFNPEEVQAVRWMNLEELEKDLEFNAASYTIWLSKALALLWQKLAEA